MADIDSRITKLQKVVLFYAHRLLRDLAPDTKHDRTTRSLVLKLNKQASNNKQRSGGEKEEHSLSWKTEYIPQNPIENPCTHKFCPIQYNHYRADYGIAKDH